MNLWYRAKHILINKVLDLSHKGNIKKTGQTITPIVDKRDKQIIVISKSSVRAQ